MNRKAQSEIITTVLLILIVLAAISVVWVVVIQFFPGPEDNFFECNDIRLVINEARSNESASIHTNEIEIKRTAGGENNAVRSVKIIIDRQAATIQKVNNVFNCTDDSDSDGINDCAEVVNGRTAYSLEQIETKTYTVPFMSIPKGALVEIAPVIEKDGAEKVCEINDRKRAI